LAFIFCHMHVVGKGVESLGIVATKNNREVPLKTVLHTFCAIAHGVVGPNIDAANTFFFVIDTGQETAIASSINNIVVGGVNGDMCRFPSCGCFPIVFPNLAAKAAVAYANGGVVLLGNIDAIGESIVGGNTIELCGGLVVVGAPGGTPVIRNLCSPVVGDNHALVVFRSNPQVVVISVRSAMRFKGFSAIGGVVIGDIHYINAIDVLGVGINFCVVPSPLAQGTAFIYFGPRGSCIVRAINPSLVFVFYDGPHPLWVYWRNGYPNDA